MQRMEEKQKREISTLIPYAHTDGGELLFFLQKRDEDAPRLPDFFGLFGGGLELGETPEICIQREIKEELDIPVNKPIFFCRFESLNLVNHVFIKEVDASFGDAVAVREGSYGTFLSEIEIQKEKICDSDKLVLAQLTKYLKGEPAF